MTTKSNWDNDIVVEREIAAFLDENLYSDSNIFRHFIRTNGYYDQMDGSDVLLTTSDGKLRMVIVDEKVAATQANKDLKTFALELSFFNKGGNKVTGWFVDNSKKTEYYLFGWINKADIPYDAEKDRWDTNSIRRDNIKELEWALVSKKKLHKFLEKKGWTLEKLGRQDEKIRENGCVKTRDFIDGVTFRYSDKYAEKPVNILLERKTYIELSDYNGVIKK